MLVILFALLLALPSLAGGLCMDDYFHRLLLEHIPLAGVNGRDLDLFVFATGDPKLAALLSGESALTRAGATIELRGLSIVVEQVTADGRPESARFAFDTPLEAPSFRYYFLTRQSFPPLDTAADQRRSRLAGGERPARPVIDATRRMHPSRNAGGSATPWTTLPDGTKLSSFSKGSEATSRQMYPNAVNAKRPALPGEWLHATCASGAGSEKCRRSRPRLAHR